jgi:hypothetical protein
MVVDGIPLANQAHAVDYVLAALEIEQVVEQLREQEWPSVNGIGRFVSAFTRTT